MTTPRVRHVVGCMTGTSLDGLDCALTRITGTGLDMTAEFVGMVSRPFDDAFRATLRHLAEGNAAPPIEFMRAARTLGVLHADAVEALLHEHREVLIGSRGVPAADAPRGRGGSDKQHQRPFPGVDFVVAHGQTIWHAPQDTLSWQLFDPWPLVKHLGVPVCYDLRQADLIAGGQGAPITPIADWVMYRGQADMVLNLGGICNGTWWQDDGGIEAADVTYCNLLHDGLVQRLFPPNRYDEDGGIAMGCDDFYEPVLCLVNDHVESVAEGQRSLGREQLTNAWFEELIAEYREFPHREDYTDAMLLVGASVHVADCLYWDVPTAGKNIVLAGGGVRNQALVKCLKCALEIRRDGKANANLILSDNLGIPCEAREAMGFAVLGALSQDGVPITLPQVTGATNPGVAGAWVYPK